MQRPGRELTHPTMRTLQDGAESVMLGPFLDVLRQGPLRVDKRAPGPLGVLFHTCDTFLGLVAEAAGEEGVSTEFHFTLLLPILELLTADVQPVVMTRVETAIFDKLLDHAYPADPSDPEPTALGDQEVGWDGLCEWLFAQGSDSATGDVAREQLYTTRRKILNRKKRYLKNLAEFEEMMAAEDAEGGAAEGEWEPPTRKRTAPTSEYDPPDLPEADSSSRALKRRRKRAEKRAAAAGETVDAAMDGASTNGSTVHDGSAKAGKKSKKSKAAAAASAVASSESEAGGKKVKSRKSVGGNAAVGDTPAKTKGDGPKTPKSKKKSVKMATTPTSAESTPVPLAVQTIKGILKLPATPPSGRRISWGKDRIRRFKKKLAPSSVGTARTTFK